MGTAADLAVLQRRLAQRRQFDEASAEGATSLLPFGALALARLLPPLVTWAGCRPPPSHQLSCLPACAPLQVIASTLRHYTGLLVQHEDDGGEPWCEEGNQMAAAAACSSILWQCPHVCLVSIMGAARGGVPTPCPTDQFPACHRRLPRCHLAAGRRGLGEPSSVAHSSMLLLALAAWEGHPDEAERRRHMAQLAAGIMHQQRKDGSFRVGGRARRAGVG